MLEIVEAINAAMSAGVNPVTAIREAFHYSIEELAVTSGLATTEIADLEAGQVDPEKLARLASSLGLPPDIANIA